MIRHGCHDVFWCYPFEREVSNFVNIRSNQLNSEVTLVIFFHDIGSPKCTSLLKWKVMVFSLKVGHSWMFINTFRPQVRHNELH